MCTLHVKGVLQHRHGVGRVGARRVWPIDWDRHAQRAHRIHTCGIVVGAVAGDWSVANAPSCTGRAVSKVMLALGASTKRATTGSRDRWVVGCGGETV